MSNLTRKAIRDSMMRLLEERPLSKITVKDIVEECGVNRNTFYYHYADIPALIEESLHELCDTIILKYPRMESLEQCLQMAIDYMITYRRAAKHIYESVNRDVFERYLWKLCEYAVNRYMDGALAVRRVTNEDRLLIVNYLECDCFGLVMLWMREGMTTDLRSRFAQLSELRGNWIEEMIERCEKKNLGI